MIEDFEGPTALYYYYHERTSKKLLEKSITGHGFYAEDTHFDPNFLWMEQFCFNRLFIMRYEERPNE